MSGQLFKNTASQKVYVFAWDTTTGVAKTGDAANITAYIAKDYGAVNQLGDTSATEVDSTNAKGYYVFDITQTETNADIILLTGKSSTANIAVVGAPATIHTRPPNAGALSIDSNGRVDVIKIAGTTQTARDIGASVLLSSGTGTGQLKLASGYAAIDWGDIANKTTTNALTNTTIATTQKVDVETIKTNPVVNGGTITFPTGATLASTTNITAGTITTTTNLTNLPAITAGWLTSTGIADNALTAAKIADGAIDAATFAAGAIDNVALATSAATEIAQSVLNSNLDSYLTANSVSDYLRNTYSEAANITSSVMPTLLDIYNFIDTEVAAIKAKTDNLPSDPADASDIAASFSTVNTTLATLATAAALSTAQTAITAIKAKTDSLTFTVAGKVDANSLYANSAQILGNGTSGNLWRGS